MMAPFVDYNPTVFVPQHHYSFARAGFCAPLVVVAPVSPAERTIVVAPMAFVVSQADYFDGGQEPILLYETLDFHKHDFLVVSSYTFSKSLHFAMVLATLFALHSLVVWHSMHAHEMYPSLSCTFDMQMPIQL